jgi:hypothetical protein
LISEGFFHADHGSVCAENTHRLNPIVQEFREK